MLVRRAVLSALAVIESPSLRFMGFTIACFIFSQIHIFIRPYREAEFNTLETAALMIHTVIAAVLTGFPGTTLPVAVQAVVVILIVGPGLAFIVFIGLRMRQHKHRHSSSLQKQSVQATESSDIKQSPSAGSLEMETVDQSSRSPASDSAI